MLRPVPVHPLNYFAAQKQFLNSPPATFTPSDFPYLSFPIKTPSKALFLAKELPLWSTTGHIRSVWSVRGIGVKEVDFTDYLEGRMESWYSQKLRPYLRPSLSYKIHPSPRAEYVAYVEFPGLVDFGKSL